MKYNIIIALILVNITNLILKNIINKRGEIMIIFDLMIVILLIISITLLSGVKIMINDKYFQFIFLVFLTCIQLLNLIKGYKLGEIGIITMIAISILFLLLFIWGYKRNTYIYSIHNVKEKDILNIIKKYLERKNIKYELSNEEIYLIDIDKSIYFSSLMKITLDCREIKNTNFYNELLDEIKVEIKEIKQRYFSIEGAFHLFFTLFFFWIRLTFFNI